MITRPRNVTSHKDPARQGERESTLRSLRKGVRRTTPTRAHVISAPKLYLSAHAPSRILTNLQTLSLPRLLCAFPSWSWAHKTLFHKEIHSLAAIHIFVYGLHTKRFPLCA